MNLVLLGPPGAGKGTQAKLLVDKYGMIQISTGEILRSASQEKTPLGMKVDEFMKSGQLVPDEIVNQIIKDQIRQCDLAKGFILDGYPRTVNQAESLDQMVAHENYEIDHVINIDLPEDEIVRRVSGRRQCRQCGAGYHIEFAPPANEDACDKCGGELSQRNDDKAEVVKERIKVYAKQNALLLDYYQKKGSLKNIPGLGKAKEVYSEVMSVLEAGS